MKTILILSVVILAAFNANAAYTGSPKAAIASIVEASVVNDDGVQDKTLSKLKSGTIETLYYGDNDLNHGIKEVIETKGNEAQLASIYRSLDDDQVNLKHTILIVMIKKQQKELVSEDGFERFKAVMVGALSDDHFWIRTEAVWGLRYFGDVTLMRRISPLVEDSNEHVRKEARATLVELYETYQDRTDNAF